MNGRATGRRPSRGAVSLLLNMAKSDPNDFWGKGNPSEPPSDPNAGFWSGAKQPAKPEQRPDPKPAEKPAAPSDGGFWGKPAEPTPASKPEPSRPQSQPDPAFWSKAEDKKKHDIAQAMLPEDQKRLAKKRRRRKIILISVGSVLLLLLVLVALAPTIAGAVAPGIVASKAGEAISGKVAVESMHFGWFGPQRVEKIRLLDTGGKEIARFSVEVDKGLFGFIRGDLDVGTVTLTGVKADIVKYPDGTTNLDKAVAPKQPSKPKPPSKPSEPKVPDSLAAHVVAHNMQVTYTDQSKPGSPMVAIQKADLDARLAPGQPVGLTFNGDAVSGDKTGKLAATIKADRLIRKDGLIQPEKAAIDADISAKTVPLQLVDAFVPLGEGASAQRGLGDTIDIALKAKGDMKSAAATLSAAATNLTANADLRVADGVLTTQSPIDVSVKGGAVLALVPAVSKSLEASKDTATITTFPDAHLTVQNLKFPLPVGGSLNLQGAGASVVLALTETAGTVTLPATTPGQKGAVEPFRISPIQAKIDTADLSKDTHVTVATGATLNNQPAGNVNVDLNVAGLLDAKGAPVSGPPGSIQGTVAIRQIATVIAQPFVKELNIDLPKDLGPTLDIEARASSDTHAAAGGSAPPTDVSISVQSQGLRVAGAMKLTDALIATSGDGFRVDVGTVGQMASRFVGPETGWRIAPGAGQGGGAAVIIVKDVNLPRDAKGGLQLDKAAAAVHVALGGLSVQSLKAPASPPIEVRTLALGSQLGGGSAKVTLDSGLAYSGSNFGMKGAFDVPRLITTAGGTAAVAPPMQLRPVGKLEIKDIPTALAQAVLPPPATPPAAPAPAPQPAGAKPEPPAPAAQPLDLAKLLSDTLGPTVTLAISTAAAQGDALNAGVTVTTATTTAEVNADVGQTQLALKKLNVQANVTPQTVSGLTAAFAPNVQGVPRLAGPAKIIVQADPLTIPLKDFKPQLERAGQASVRLSLPGRTVVDGLVATNPDGTKRELGRVGVDSLEVAAKVPVGALVGPALPEERRALVTLAGTVLGNDNAPMLELSGRAQADISDAKLMGALAANFKVDKINTRSIESFTGQQGLLTGALGDTASVELAANITPPAAAPGQNPDMSKATGDATVTLAAPRLHTDGPIRAVLDATAIRIDKPTRLTLDADPAFINKLLEPKPTPAAPGQKAPADQKPAEPAVRFTDPAVITVMISSLVYPRPGVAEPAPLAAALGVSVPSLKMISSDKQPIRLSQLAVSVNADPPKPGLGPWELVTFHMDVAEASVGDQPSAKALALNGSVTNLLSEKGEVSTANASLSVAGDLPVIPTALIDALAKQNGILVEGLGPVVTVKTTIERYPLGELKPGGAPPVIEAHAKAQRANADLRGTIRAEGAEMVYVSETPIKLTVLELTQVMAAHLVKGLPIMGTVEKTPKEAPGVVDASNMTVPLGNDMSKLNGHVTVDPGEARFGTSGAFATILKSIKQRQAGTVGQRLEPLNMDIKSGVITYQKWRVPIGDFSVDTEGTVDLVKRTIDVETWVPFGALGEEAIGGVGSISGLGGAVLEAATMIPFKTSGSLDKPSTKLDTAMFAKTVLKTLRPDNLLKQGAEDLKKLVPGGK
jgi:hypothetical protein